MIARIRDGFDRNTWWSRLIFSSLILVAMLIYVVTGQIATASGRYLILKFPFDDQIPFIPAFVIPYVYWYLQIAISILWLSFSRKSGRILHRLAISILIANLVSAVFYLAMPTIMIRPELLGDDILTRLVGAIYAADIQYNCFPSTHVSWTLIIGYYWFLAGPRKLWFHLINFGGSLLVVASTVLIKQHYFPDIPGGMAVAALSIALTGICFRFIHIWDSN